MKIKIIIFAVLLSGVANSANNTQVKVGFGSSSNPSQSMEPVDGSFSQFMPEWRQLFHQKDSVVFAAALSANLRLYNDEFLASNANFQTFRGELSAESDITPLLTGGLKFHAAKTIGHIASPRIKDTYGEANGFNEFGLGIFGGTHWGNWAWKLETNFLGRDFDITSYDDKENMILDDHKDFHNILRVIYDPEGDLKVELAGSFRNRHYVDVPLNPFSKLAPPAKEYQRPLEFIQEDYLITVTPELDDFKSETLILMGWDVDRTNGATTQKRGRLTQKFEFPFWRNKLKLRPLLDVCFKYFPNLTLPLIPVPRSDTIITAAVELGFSFTKELDAAIGYYKLGSSSNSLVHNYYEDLLSTELTATF